jgi:hypothetical protein
MKNALKAMPQECRRQNERQLKSLRKVCSEAMSKLAAQKTGHPVGEVKKNMIRRI